MPPINHMHSVYNAHQPHLTCPRLPSERIIFVLLPLGWADDDTDCQQSINFAVSKAIDLGTQLHPDGLAIGLQPFSILQEQRGARTTLGCNFRFVSQGIFWLIFECVQHLFSRL
jgi:hypothetical protein